MKKSVKYTIVVIVLLSFLLLMLTGCVCKHEWVEATCTEPKTCALCGETEGEALGHNWTSATCTSPKTCVRCGMTEGEALGHDWIEATCTEPKTCYRCGIAEGNANGHTFTEWKEKTKASCTQEGLEARQCEVCGEEETREIPKLSHKAGSWVVIKQATVKESGVRVRKCQYCGEELQRESFEMSKSEKVNWLKQNCKSNMYDDLARSPDKYKGTYVKFQCRILQIASEASSALYYSTYRAATKGRYDDVVYLCIDNYGSGVRILEDDTITIYGYYDGLLTYTTVLGASVTIPKIIVLHYE